MLTCCLPCSGLENLPPGRSRNPRGLETGMVPLKALIFEFEVKRVGVEVEVGLQCVYREPRGGGKKENYYIPSEGFRNSGSWVKALCERVA